MDLDDLARDGKPQAGVLPEALARAIGIKSFENPFEGIGGNAGAVIVDDDLETVSHVALGRIILGRTQQHANASAWGRKRSCIVDEVIENLAKPRIMPEYHVSWPPAIIGVAMARDDKFHPDRTGILDQVRHGHNRIKQARQIDEIDVVARQFGIEPGGVGYIADQPIEPANVVLD